jgi:hypothetical protein
MSFCIFPDLNCGTKCTGCDWRLPMKYERAPIRECGDVTFGTPPSTPAEREKLLGDYTKELLESIGITKEFYIGIKDELGFAPTCDCDGRIAWLNKAHAAAKRLAAKLLAKS